MEETGREEANPLLIEYLDYDILNDRIDFLLRKRDSMTERLLRDISMCEEITIPDDNKDLMFDSLLRALQTKARYEINRR